MFLLAISIKCQLKIGIRAIEMERVLAEAANEEKMMRQRQQETLMESWSSALMAKQSLPKEPETDYDNCGTAAAQRFAGEDTHRDARIRSQQLAMREAVREQVSERERMRREEAEEEREWAEHVRESARIREEAERM